MRQEGTFADVLAANERYAESYAHAGLSGRAARGLAVLTCIDSRIEPLAMLGLEPGDAKILRNPGARVDDATLETLVLCRWLLGVERAMVIAHTDCRMTAPGPETLREAIRQAGGPETSGLSFQAAPDPLDCLRTDVARLRSSALLDGLESGGFLYDVATGKLEEIV